MKQFGRFVFAIGSALGLCFVGSATASLLLPSSASDMPPRQLDVTDLWTSVPVRVDPAKQTFERLASIAPVDPPSPRPAPVVVTQKIETDERPAALPSQEHLAWCAKRYRSYDPATDSYRSYSGAVRACISPYTAESETPSVQPGLSQAHIAWCASRYRSYREEDNTYRSYSGQQRDCLSPFMQNG